MRAAIPLIRVSALQVAATFLERGGAPVERLLGRANLSPRVLERPEALVPFAAAARFMEEAARIEGIEDLGIRIGQQSDLAQLGTFGGLIGQSRTLLEALRAAYRAWSGFNSGVRAWMTVGSEDVELHHMYLAGTDETWRQFAGACLVHHLNLVSSAAGPAGVQRPPGSPPGPCPGATPSRCWPTRASISDRR